MHKKWVYIYLQKISLVCKQFRYSLFSKLSWILSPYENFLVVYTVWSTYSILVTNRSRYAHANGGCFFPPVDQQPLVDQGLLIIQPPWPQSGTHTTIGRTPLDEWSARHSAHYLTTHNTHNRKTSMPPVRFKQAIPSKRATADPRLRPRGHRDRLWMFLAAQHSFFPHLSCSHFAQVFSAV